MIYGQPNNEIPSLATASEDPLAMLLLGSPLCEISIVSSLQVAAFSTFDWSDMAAIVDHSGPTLNLNFPTATICVHQSSCQENNEAEAENSDFSTATFYQRPQLERSYSSSSDDSDSDDSHCSLSSLVSESQTDLITREQQREKKQERKVTFSDFVQIRTHNVTIGDHPCCRGGMALTCDWDHEEEEEMVDFVMFEATSLKRRGSALRLSFAQRRERLQGCTGLSMSQLMKRENEILFGSNSSFNLLGDKRKSRSSCLSLNELSSFGVC